MYCLSSPLGWEPVLGIFGRGVLEDLFNEGMYCVRRVAPAEHDFISLAFATVGIFSWEISLILRNK